MINLSKEPGFLKYVKDLISNNKRYDGRDFYQYRDIKIIDNFIPNSEGSCYIELGKTKMISAIKFNIGESLEDEEGGNLIVSLDIQRNFTEEDHENLNIEYARVIDRIIRQSKFIDMKKLKIDDKYSWYIFIDLYVIQNHGNIIDAGVLSSVRALINARIPTYKKEGDSYVVEQTLSDMKLPLNMDNVPVSITFAKIDDKYVVDPNIYEEEIADFIITFGVTNSINGLQTRKSGGINLDDFYNLSKKIFEIRPTLLKYIL